MKSIGHGGASAFAPANSLRSFRLAEQLGADAVEFDVRLVRGRLVMAHTVVDGCRPGCVPFEEGMAWLADELDRRVELVVDFKTARIEGPVLAALARHGLRDRVTLTSQCRPILARVREIDHGARTAISIAGRVSRARQHWTDWRDEVVDELAAGSYDAVMVHRSLVDPRLVELVHAAGAEIHAWTVRGAREADALMGMDVDGIVTTDPRLVPR
jgi:glycerophosphoryl diester phosphodiesterase